MKLFNKIRWVASILLVILIVLATNMIDRNNFSKLKYSVTTIYEDRIVASDLLFEMLLLVQEKQVAFISSDSLFFQGKNEKNNHEIDGLIERYEKTKLTDKEQYIFNDLKDELRNLKNLEKQLVLSKSKNNSTLLKRIDPIVQHLHELSKVQLEESRHQVSISNRTMDTINLFTQVEIVFLILMAILIQIIILYKPKPD
jgi:hypothetical protein